MRKADLTSRAWNRVGTVLTCLLLAIPVQANLIGLTKRDYHGNHPATDRFTFPDPYRDVEWLGQTDPDNVWAVVYTMGGTMSITLRFMNPQLTPQSGTFEVDDVRLRVVPGGGTPYTVQLSATDGQQLEMAAEGGWDELTFTISGLPAYVTRGYIEITAHVQGPNGPLWNTGQYQAWEWVFETFSAPCHVQEPVWTDLLWYSTAWAHARDDLAEATSATTFGLYWGQVFAYNSGTPFIPSEWVITIPDTGETVFRLADFLDELSDEGMQPGNCFDVSCFLQVCLDSLGINSQLQYLTLEPGEDGNEAWITNLVCPIGSDGSDPDLYVQLLFTMHQQCKPSPGVCDAALAYMVDLSGQPHRNPAANWLMDDYWQKWAGATPAQTYGHVYRDFVDGSDEIYNYTPPGRPWSFPAVNPDPSIPPRMVNHNEPLLWSLDGVL